MKVKYNIYSTALGSTWGERDWTNTANTADHLIFDGHHLFDLTLVKKKVVPCRGQKALRSPRLVGEVPQ